MNSFGRIFRLHIFGESHGNGIGILLDGVPAGLALSENDFLDDLSRRRSGAAGTTPRKESDLPALLSGVHNGFTTGAPVLILFQNHNTKSSDYDNLRDIPRPGHADFTASVKFGGYADHRGGGHFSGRITLGLVAAGVVAKKMIAPAQISSQILEIGGETDINKAIEALSGTGDSAGGIIECTVQHVPAGLGEPFFDSVEACISHLVFSVPAIKGIEFGSGFAAARMRGSQHNDAFVSTGGKTATNNAAGINGGITNGNDIVFRVAVKPTSSIALPQQTMNMRTGLIETLAIEGRHDACIALRVPVIIEAVAAIALADFSLLRKASAPVA